MSDIETESEKPQEKDIWNIILYAEEIFIEFGISKIYEDALLEMLDLTNRFYAHSNPSEKLKNEFNRHFNRHAERLNKAYQTGESEKHQSNTNCSWLEVVISVIALIFGAFAFWSWLFPKQPEQIYHHHNGQITENVNVHLSGTIKEDLKINWPISWR